MSAKLKFFFIGILAIVALIATGCYSTPEEVATVPAGADLQAAATQTLGAAYGQATLNAVGTQADIALNGMPAPTGTATLAPTPLPGNTAQPTTAPAATAPAPDAGVTLAGYTDAQGTDGMAEFVPVSDATHGQWADDALNPTQFPVSRCWRAWQARNGQNTTWVSLFCDMKSSGDVDISLVEPYRVVITGTGTLRFLLVRDLRAVEQLTQRGDPNASRDPYDVFLEGDNSYPDEYGISAYWKGQGEVLDQFGNWISFEDCSFFQVPLGKGMTGAWLFTFKVSGVIELWLGSLEPSQCLYGCGQITVENLFPLPYIQPTN